MPRRLPKEVEQTHRQTQVLQPKTKGVRNPLAILVRAKRTSIKLRFRVADHQSSL